MTYIHNKVAHNVENEIFTQKYADLSHQIKQMFNKIHFTSTIILSIEHYNRTAIKLYPLPSISPERKRPATESLLELRLPR